MDISHLDPSSIRLFGRTKAAILGFGPNYEKQDQVETEHFYLFCPKTSEWPDEVWVAPKKRGNLFGQITDVEISDLAQTLSRLIQILDLRHGHEFSFNFYIYPGNDWYLRLIPRIKILGGFEIGTGIFVNTQDSKETMAFIKEHLQTPDIEKIKNILAALDEKERLLEVINRTLAKKIDILIGNETEFTALNDCSLVVSRYESKNGTSGRIAILGPKG